MVPSRSGSARASLTSRCCSSKGSSSKRGVATVTWKWSPPPVRSSTRSSVASGNARARSSRSGAVAMPRWYRRESPLWELALVCEVLEQVGAREHAQRLALSGNDDGVRATGQRREHLVERLIGLDGGERRLHRRSHVLVERVGVLEDAVEQIAVLERADHVGE